MPYDASPEAMTLTLEELDTIGKVEVEHRGPDVNNCYSWLITFLTSLGSLPLLTADGLDLKGTVATVSVSKFQFGVPPPFDGPKYQFYTLVDLSGLAIVASPLRQGVNYYFRVRASNEFGSGPATTPYTPFEMPLPQPPGAPSEVQISVKNGSSLAVEIHYPQSAEHAVSYRVDYSTRPFANERQMITLTCVPNAEIQTVTTSAADFNEIQYIIMDSAYRNYGVVPEEQRVQCDASGGNFGLTFVR